MYEYRYNIIYYNIIPVLVITTWIFGWFTIHPFTFYVLFLTLVSLTFHNSNFDKRVITYSVAYINTFSLFVLISYKIEIFCHA